jgi:hypothetical protein
MMVLLAHALNSRDPTHSMLKLIFDILEPPESVLDWEEEEG